MGTSKTAETAAPARTVSGVRFLLSELLSELDRERAAGTSGMARVDQGEIRKLFKAKAASRARSAK